MKPNSLLILAAGALALVGCSTPKQVGGAVKLCHRAATQLAAFFFAAQRLALLRIQL